jgi:hypothetical protein
VGLDARSGVVMRAVVTRRAMLVLVGVAGAAIGPAGCGDNKGVPDATIVRDTGTPDVPGLPLPPALGAQIDRMGRPVIATALIAVLAAAGPAKTAQKDTYNQATDPATWPSIPVQTNVTIAREMAGNLAVFDALDKGLATPVAGCGSALKYVGPPDSLTYLDAAILLADDQLYVDTSRQTCSVYLALEIENASRGTLPHTTCGGRMLGHDVIDVTYSLLLSGLAGLDQTNNFSPRIRDGVGVHPDISDSFPFLGAPN